MFMNHIIYYLKTSAYCIEHNMFEYVISHPSRKFNDVIVQKLPVLTRNSGDVVRRNPIVWLYYLIRQYKITFSVKSSHSHPQCLEPRRGSLTRFSN